MGCGSSASVDGETYSYKKPAPFHLTSRIAIIGGGVGGLHMACELKEKGYEYVTVLEKESEVGGKAYSEGHTCSVTGATTSVPDPLAVDLLEDLALFKEIHLLDSKETREYSKSSNCLLSKLEMAKEVTGIKGSRQLKLILKSQLSKFEQVYRKMVDKYGFPKERYISEMVKPVGQFLSDHGLYTLSSLVNARLRAQGYDRGDLITFYALFFLDPKFLQPDGITLRLENLFGWQDVWKRLVNIHKIHVECNKMVESVELVSEHSLKLQIKDLMSESSYTDFYDFCILAIPNPLDVIKRPSYLQQKYLSKYGHFNPVLTTIYKVTNKNRIPLILDQQSNYFTECQTGLCLYRKDYTSNVHNIDVAYMYFQNDYVIERDQLPALEKSLFNQIEFLTDEAVVEKLHTRVHNHYLPHCSVDDVRAGVPWELFRLQGEKKMWFTSALTSFDLTQSIINYNMKLLDQYDI